MAKQRSSLTRQPGHDAEGFDEKIPATGLGHMFTRAADAIAMWMGHPLSFIVSSAFIVLWLLSGPLFNWSSDWQLIVNTGTTVITFLMVFVIQNTQNRDSRAVHLKLDELLRAEPRARNELMEAEEEDLDEIEREKAIVDKDDPDPPAHKKRETRTAKTGSGNGRPH
jgi:low affinity Fe/Cu permease